jgi:probable HAF family extracellular repeat protein
MSRYTLVPATLLALGLAACTEEPTRPPERAGAASSIAAADAVGPRCFGGRPFVLTDLGTLPGATVTSSRALGINDLGQVSGDAVAADGRRHGILWTASAGFQDIGIPPSGEGELVAFLAVDINERGQVTGTAPNQFSSSASRAFLWTQSGGFQGLGTVPPHRGFAEAQAINERGHVVGFSGTDFGDFAPFLWTPESGMRNLGFLPGSCCAARAEGVNDRDHVVGNMEFDARAFLWTAATGMRELRPPAGFSTFFAADINNQGQIVGTGQPTGDFAFHAVLRAPTGAFRDLGTLRGTNSVAHAINERAQVVGTSFVSGGSGSRAFLWTRARGLQDLGALPGRSRNEAHGINNRGQLVGVSGDVVTSSAVLWTLLSGPTPVHELGTMRALMAETQSLVPQRKLTRAQARSLVLVLERAHEQLETRHRLAAITRLREYVSSVRTLISGGQLPRADGQALLDAATCAITRLSG